MPLIPLLPIFHRFNRKYFDGLLSKDLKPLVAVRWSDGRLRNTAGFYRRSKKGGQHHSEIVLSTPLLINLPYSAVESTLCHEMIHAWIDLVLGIQEGHGPIFKKKMTSINSLQENFQITVRHQYPVPNRSPKWWAICPSCGLRFPYKRIVKGAACKKCCDANHHGKWNAGCVLCYEPFLKEA